MRRSVVAAEETGRRNPVLRREFLARAGGGIGSLALMSLLQQDGALAGPNPHAPIQVASAGNPLAAKMPHYMPKVKRVISLFMFGGMSQVDSFDPKEELTTKDGHSVAGRPGFDTMGRSAPGKLMKSPWEFKRYGKSGLPASDLFPHIGGCVDDIAFIRSMVSESNNHV